ncbi:MAG: ATP synthase F1 subunit gamma [Bacteroidia bacterium]|jgi:F-type H+-transporting ATPase subunit gamma|nr:ATP synthase F1 subunit gamma [Bacteroidia bacterium]
MPNLKEVRNRITSVQSTQQITSAMKMVSAAKLRRAQDAITQMRPYAQKLREILENLSASLDSTEGVYSRQREVKNVLFVVITSNRGLCGGFNANVIKRTTRAIRENYPTAKVSYITIGKKGGDFFRKTPYTAALPELGSLNVLFDKLTFVNTAPVAEAIMKAFAEGQYDKVLLVYNQFKNAAVQVTQAEQFLPVVPTASANASSKTDYIFEPEKAEIVQDLIPRSLKTQLYKALLDSHASEHGARMTAMHKATDNAKELLRSLRISYNKARQAAITNEILEIVGGAEALKG